MHILVSFSKGAMSNMLISMLVMNPGIIRGFLFGVHFKADLVPTASLRFPALHLMKFQKLQEVVDHEETILGICPF